MKKFLLLFLGAIFSVILQSGFLNSLGAPLNNINLVLCLVIFLVIIFDYRVGLLFGVLAGIFLDIYSPLFFGLSTVIFLLIALGVNFLFSNFFTNKSLYSLIVLGGVSILFYEFFLYLLVFLAFYFGVLEFRIFLDYFWFKKLISEILLNILVLILMFFIVKSGSKRLRAVFIFND
ncbi:MAG: rod shape-determining protein MreD [Patescibacteria group bacterium]|nr:rod shape-determining protein MreD [Patescibacteria group bacterium]MDD5490452.1 rod shape-determining protein MreD [Patescibacteria group bacterium]